MLSAMRWTAAFAGLLTSLACTTEGARPVAPATPDAGVTAADDAAAPVVPDATLPSTDASTAPDVSASPDDAGVESGPSWCRDVQPIVTTKCALCHGVTPAFGARVSLVRFADSQVDDQLGVPMHERMATRVTAPQSRMPPPNQPQLTTEEVATIVRWSMAGAPEGTCAPAEDAGVAPDASTSAPDAGLPINTTTLELRAHAAGSAVTPYALPTDGTNYQCWSFRIPPGGAPEQYIVRFEHLIDNVAHLHHTLFFRNRAADSPDGPFGCGSPELDWDMVSGWAPGQPDESMPQGVGVRAFPGDQFVLQAHYDQVSQAGQVDQSGIRLVMTDQAGLQEASVLWAGGAWTNTISGNNVRRRGERTMNTPFTMFSIFPHMHKLGTRITLELRRAGTQRWELVGEVPAWSFDDQPKLSVPLPLQQVQRGDTLRTTCWWDTMGRNVGFGEASDDEMCFNFVHHYPSLSNPTTAALMFLQ